MTDLRRSTLLALSPSKSDIFVQSSCESLEIFFPKSL